MEFTHEFVIPLGVEEALAVLTDLERVAPCMPGATLEEVDGDTYSGRVKVKVGPMSLTYAGDATVTEVDHDNHIAKIAASGSEKRGSGTASADVAADLEEVDDGTKVVVVTDLNITGKPAQFGRGVMADVGGAIIQRFADNLRDQLLEEQRDDGDATPGAVADDADADTDAAAPPVDDGIPGGAAGAETAAAAAGAVVGADPTSSGTAATGPRRVESRPPRDEALDILDVAGDTATAKVLPIVVAALAVVIIILILRRRGDDGLAAALGAALGDDDVADSLADAVDDDRLVDVLDAGE